MAEKKADLKQLVDKERLERIEKCTAILKKAIEEIEGHGCVVDISVLVTPRGNQPQINIISKE